MPPKIIATSRHALWQCPSCTVRSFSAGPVRRQVGPEHPRYIDIPEPPQQLRPSRPPVKGVLPVPRDIFAGMRGEKEHLQNALRQSTLEPASTSSAEPGSREEWRKRIAEQRRRNLREGIVELDYRKQRTDRTKSQRAAQRAKENREALHRPEREDERLTTPSHNLDLDVLMHGNVPDPTRRQRLHQSRMKVAAMQDAKRRERMEHLHSLYTKARSFIVTKKQLDEAIEKTFGTDENPILFSTDYSNANEAHSIWALGRPDRVQDMIARVNGTASTYGMMPSGYHQKEINRDRIKKVAEILTGGDMDEDTQREL